MISQVNFQNNFPADTEVPDLLLRLLEYQNEVSDFYSGHIELMVEDADGVTMWFDGDRQAASQFIPFGRGPDGSSCCFWLDGGKLLFADLTYLSPYGTRRLRAYISC